MSYFKDIRTTLTELEMRLSQAGIDDSDTYHLINNSRIAVDELEEQLGAHPIVIVLSTSNYTNGEETPFKAIIKKVYDHETVVESLKTGREYELYSFQILEQFDIEDIRRLINMRNYGI